MKALINRLRRRGSVSTSLTFEELRQQRLTQLEQHLPDATPQERDLIASVEPLTMTSPERILALCHGVDHIVKHQIAGDIVECGVWRGGSMVATAKTLIGHDQVDRRLWLYDTFDGMSAPSSEDVDFMGQSASGLLAEQDREDAKSIWCFSPMEQVREAMATTGYPTDQINFVPGKVEETLPKTTPGKIALLRLDTDWYESTRCELEHLFPKMVDGGVLIIDDYGHWEGCRRAVDEYFDKHGVQIFLQRIDYTGRMAIVKK